MRISNTLVLATQNPDKLHEMQAIFSAFPEVTIASADQFLRNASKLSFVETHDTYLGNATAKARLVNLGCHYPALGDDSGLEVDALGGRPGVRSFRYAKLATKDASRESQDEANRQLLLKEVAGQGGTRDARFRTTLALCVEGLLLHATGTLEGIIADEPRGSHGFGYDSVFIPKGSRKTLAEMTDQEKNAISHRSRAAVALMEQARAAGLLFVRP